jgi:hypothetical protein
MTETPNPWAATSTDTPPPPGPKREIALGLLADEAKAQLANLIQMGLVTAPTKKARRKPQAARQAGSGDEQSGKPERPTMAFLAQGADKPAPPARKGISCRIPNPFRDAARASRIQEFLS